MSPALFRQMEEHALTTPDREVCGFVYADAYVALRNVSRDPNRFEADPRDLARTLAIRGEPIAVFHTHPNGAPEPSPSDLRESYYLNSKILIGRLENGVLSLSDFAH
jgi:proteasome lid subunit RPN8/RPN11